MTNINTIVAERTSEAVEVPTTEGVGWPAREPVWEITYWRTTWLVASRGVELFEANSAPRDPVDAAFR